MLRSTTLIIADLEMRIGSFFKQERNTQASTDMKFKMIAKLAQFADFE